MGGSQAPLAPGPSPARGEGSGIRLAVLASGGGRTLQNLIDRIADGRLNATVVRVFASNPAAFVAERAKNAGIPTTVVPPKPAMEASSAIFDRCRQERVELVLMAGWVHLLPIADDFLGRVMNIHPSLIPAFCGKGWYGLKIHAAAVERGVKVSGCTVHFVDNEYDHGPIILQTIVPVLDDDWPERLAARVFAAECDAYPEAVKLFQEGRLRIEGNRVRVGTGSP
jgi:phosphoribosylglycinamide formyltransferase-1